MADYDDDDTLRIVLVGKTGNGKSSLGNTLIDSDDSQVFKVGRGLKSQTVHCGWRCGEIGSIRIEVTDTPGLCDTALPEEVIHKEVGKSVAVSTPGPHIFLFVVRADRRFTEEEYKAYEIIKEIFTEDMNNFLLIVFNGIDCYDCNTIAKQWAELDESIREYIADPKQKNLRCLLNDASRRYIGMNNKVSGEDKQQQRKAILEKMLDIKNQNSSKYYDTCLTRDIQRRVEELAEEKAKAKHIPPKEANREVKQDIVDNKEPGFLSFVGDVIGSVASGVADACSLM